MVEVIKTEEDFFRNAIEAGFQKILAPGNPSGVYIRDVMNSENAKTPSVFITLDNSLKKPEYTDDGRYDLKQSEYNGILYVACQISQRDVKKGNSIALECERIRHLIELAIDHISPEAVVIENSELDFQDEEIDMSSMAVVGSIPAYEDGALIGEFAMQIKILYTKQYI